MLTFEKFKIYLLIVFAIAHIFISIFAIIPSSLSIDEDTYHLMTKNFSESGGFEIWNGYREFPSAELESTHIFARNGRLVPQYPYLYPILCIPFYKMFGYYGIFFVNAIAFLGIVILCYAISQRLFGDRNQALNACLILILATFSWEYSQAAWPHATEAVFIMSAFYLFIRAFYQESENRAFLPALACGLIVGLATGIRLDAIFALPCFVIPFLFLKPSRPWLSLSAFVGALPGLTILSLTNYIKFGVLHPFSYGRSAGSFLGVSEIKRYFPFIGLIIIAVGGLWILTRYPVSGTLQRYKRLLVVTAFLLTMILSVIPGIRKTVVKPLSGTYQLIVDFRIRDLDIREGGLARSQGGGMIYMGGLKKSLLQSCPYLMVLLLPLLKIIRFDREHIKLTILFLVPLIFISFYSYRGGWHGGLCLNLRYFILILPFTSILSAYAWRELSGSLNWKWDSLPLLLCLITACVFLLLLRKSISIDQEEFSLLTMPLLLALVLIVFLIMRMKFYPFNSGLFSRVTVATVFVAMVWSSLVAFLYDYPLARRFRRYNLNIAENATKIVANNSILFTHDPESFFGLVEKKRIRIANPSKDEFHDFTELIIFHLKKGHSVYTAFNHSWWAKIEKKGLLAPFKVVPINFDKDFIFSQITY